MFLHLGAANNFFTMKWQFLNNFYYGNFGNSKLQFLVPLKLEY
jgi:hypothetical protein